MDIIWNICLVHLIVSLLYAELSEGACTWPSQFGSSVWLDSRRGTLTFDTTNMTGWAFTKPGQGGTIQNWECYLTSTLSSNTSRIIIRATSNVTQFGVVYVPFVCLELNQVTDYSYYYYQLANEEYLVNYDRIRMVDTMTLTTYTPTESYLCSPSNGPAVGEYHVIVKNSKSQSAIVECHQNFFGSYYYSISDGTTTYCNQGNENWDVCATKQTMVFDYSICSTHVAYSTSGIVNCVANVTAGSYVYQTVINTDIALTSGSKRFTCFMAAMDTGGALAVSQAPGSCTRTQIPTSRPVQADGTVTGYTLSLTPHTNGLCPYTTTTTTTTTTSTSTTTTTSTTTSTTTTTPTTTSTTSTTTTTTPTTTSTTTTTPTTTTTTPTTTTSTTTTTTPTTTTTTPTTTTSTSTTTTTPTTTETQQTTTESPLKTYVTIALIIGCLIVFLIIVLIVVVVVLRFCNNRKPKQRPKTPDLIIETMPHKMFGKGPPFRNQGPAPSGTSALIDQEVQKEIIVFPEAKSNNFLLTVARAQKFSRNDIHQKNQLTLYDKPHSRGISNGGSNSFAETSEVRSNDTTKKNSISNEQHRQSDLSFSESINMDEKINFALRYDPRMMAVKREWDKSRSEKGLGNYGIQGSRTNGPLAISYEESGESKQSDSVQRNLSYISPNLNSSRYMNDQPASQFRNASIIPKSDVETQTLSTSSPISNTAENLNQNQKTRLLSPLSKQQLFISIANPVTDNLATDTASARSARSVDMSMKSITTSSVRDITVSPIPESEMSLPVSLNHSHEVDLPIVKDTHDNVQRTSTPVSIDTKRVVSPGNLTTAIVINGRAPEVTTMPEAK